MTVHEEDFKRADEARALYLGNPPGLVPLAELKPEVRDRWLAVARYFRENVADITTAEYEALMADLDAARGKVEALETAINGAVLIDNEGGAALNPKYLHEPAASPWNYDMDAAPRDGTRVLLAWQYEGEVHAGCFYYYDDGIGDYVWWSGGEFLAATDPVAWAAINLPEVPK